MKILQEQKTVEYFGMSIVVPNEHGYLATDNNGRVYWYDQPPRDDFYNHAWTYESAYSSYSELAKVDLQGVDWRDTLMEIEL